MPLAMCFEPEHFKDSATFKYASSLQVAEQSQCTAARSSWDHQAAAIVCPGTNSTHERSCEEFKLLAEAAAITLRAPGQLGAGCPANNHERELCTTFCIGKSELWCY